MNCVLWISFGTVNFKDVKIPLSFGIVKKWYSFATNHVQNFCIALFKRKIQEIFPGIFFFLFWFFFWRKIFLIEKTRRPSNFIFMRKEIENIRFKNLLDCSQFFAKDFYMLSNNNFVLIYKTLYCRFIVFFADFGVVLTRIFGINGFTSQTIWKKNWKK